MSERKDREKAEVRRNRQEDAEEASDAATRLDDLELLPTEEFDPQQIILERSVDTAEQRRRRTEAREKIRQIKRDLPGYENAADDYRKFLAESYYPGKEKLENIIERLKQEQQQARVWWRRLISRNPQEIQYELSIAQQALQALEGVKNQREANLQLFRNVAADPVAQSATLPETLRDYRRSQTRKDDWQI